MHGLVHSQEEARIFSEAANVLLVDDHALVAETVAAVVSAQNGFDIVTSASVGEAIAQIKERGSFDAILLDFNIPGTDGFDALAKVIEANNGRVALFSGNASRSVVERALALGASGFIPKTLAVSSLLNAIRFIAAGEIYLPAEYITGSLGQLSETGQFKHVENKVLELLCEGLPNKEIARALDLTEVSIKMHVKSICGKLGARNRTQAVLAAQQANLC